MTENLNQVPKVPDVTQEDVEKLKIELTTTKQGLEHVVDELKEERRKRREAEEKLNPSKPIDEVSEKVRVALMEDKKKQAELNRVKALEKFQEENKEFHPDNDPGGLKMALLQKELNGLKTDDAVLAEDFLSLLDKAKRLIPTIAPETPVTIVPIASTPTTATPPRVRVESKLTPKEQQAAQSVGWTEEKFLKIKTAQPRFVEQLLSR